MSGHPDDDPRRARAALAERLLAEHGSVSAAARASGLPAISLRAWLGQEPERLCSGCGASLAHRDAERCRACEGARRRRWTEQALLEARERWRALYGRPPSSYDWNPTLGSHYEPGRWPPAAAVRRRFGRWRDFLAAKAP